MLLVVLCVLFAVTGTFASRPVSHSSALKGEPMATIVLSTGNGMWNTGVWPGYGDSDVVALRWAADGVVVDKRQCAIRSSCYITHDQSYEATADAIVMETVNHPKFLGAAARSTPFPFPSPRQAGNNPLLGMFYYEPSVWYPEYTTDPQMRARFDFFMEPRGNSSVPLSMVCPWGYPDSVFLAPSPRTPDRLIAVVGGSGMDPFYSNWVQWLIEQLGEDIDVYEGPHRNTAAPGPPTVPERIQLMRSYRFVLVAEEIALDDWVSPEFSQALVAGAVPVYIGAPNILDFVPDQSAIVNIRDWFTKPASELANHLRSFKTGASDWNAFQKWRFAGRLRPEFQKKLSQCVYYAECRLCELVHTEMAKRAKK